MFPKGGAVPYTAYPRFQALQAEESAMVHDVALIEDILPLVPGLTERLQAGRDVADIGCGRGHAINLMAKAFPQSRFVGYDFSEAGIAAGKEEAQRLNLTNARFETLDVAAGSAAGQYNFVTAFDSIHDQAQPSRVLKNIATALRRGGTFLVVDIAASTDLHENVEHPLAPMLYAVSVMHCMTVSLAYGGEGLGTMWGEQTARQYLADAGFHADRGKTGGDFINNYYIAVK
jgi:SAM-dependent methyltransferase